jgi:hypothetical protein
MTDKNQLHIARRTIKLPPGATDINAYEILEIFFREVLEETPEVLARRMADAYREGKAIQVTMMESNYGKYRKTAFRWGITLDERLLETKGVA